MNRRTTRTALTSLLAALALGLSACGSGDGGSEASAEPSAKPSASASKSGSEAGVQALPAVLDKTLSTLDAKVGDNATVVVGKDDAKHTVTVYEDPRCPYCKEFEEKTGQTLALAAAAGSVRIEYQLASFLDENLGGSGSKRAVNAMRASVEEGGFPRYHALVFRNQPNESEDGFTDAFLLDIAAEVEGLRSNAFEKAVKGGEYKAFVTDSQKAFTEAEVDGEKIQGTPTVAVDGKLVDSANLVDGDKFRKVLEDAGITLG